MINLILAILSSALVSIMMRVSEERVKNNIGLLSVNYITCLIAACFHTGVSNLIVIGDGFSKAVVFGIVNGIFYIGSFVLFQYNVKKNGVVLSAVFMKLGVLVPTLMSVIIFHESLKALQILGFGIAIAAIILIHFESSSINVSFKAGLFLLVFGCGLADGMSKIYEELGSAKYEEQFLLCTFFVAFILSLFFAKYKRQRIEKAELIYGILLGIPNYYSARFLLKALGSVPAVIVYPTYSVASIAVVSFAGILIFREKMSKKQILAIILITVSLVLLN